MKKRFFATVLTLALSAVMLMGCGSSPAEAETDPANIPAEFAEPAESDGPAIPDDSTAETTSNTYVVNEQDEAITQFPNDNSMDDDFGRPPEEDLVSWDVEESEEDVAEEVPVTGEIEGIIVVQADWRNQSVLSYTVFAVDPETGGSQEVSQFHFTDINQSNNAEYAIHPALNLGRYANLYGYFSSDYTKIAATKLIASSGEEHAGWIDTAGNFFDVTEALNEQAQTDFDEPASYYAVGFQGDVFMYVYSDDKQENQYYGVSVDNITPGSSWEIDAADSMIGADYTTWNWLNKNYKPTCWLNDDQILVETLQNHSKEGKCRIATISTQTLEEYLPGEDTNSNWSAVASPDGSKVAFISRRVDGKDVNFYITSISGENPTKLEPDFVPVFSPSTEILLTYGGACCYILEWR